MSRPARWILIAFLLLFAWMMVSGWHRDPPRVRAMTAVFAGLMVLFALGIAWPSRFMLALRVVAASVAIAYLIYFVSEVRDLLRGEDQHLRPGRPSALLAGIGLLVYGVPAIIFALGTTRVGVFRLLDRAKPRPADEERPV
jgi:hypothetical protein